MDILETLQLSEILHEVSSILLIPTVIVLLCLIVYALWSIGSIIVELVRERRDYRVYIPELVARLESAPMDELSKIVDESGLLVRQKDDAKELISYLYLSEDARIEVAKRLLTNSNARNQHVVSRNESASRVAPMVGLMGTLIPLGPGIVALGTGDLETLSDSLLVAFDTTVAGLATSVVCFLIARVRRGWYSDYTVSMEAVFNTLLERGQKAHEEGYEFDRNVFVYDIGGKYAIESPLDQNEDHGKQGNASNNDTAKSAAASTKQQIADSTANAKQNDVSKEER